MSHYFDVDPSVPERRSWTEFTVWGRTKAFETSTGVFSGGHLDKATRLLLERSEPPPAGSVVLDLGCGWGPIACSLAAAGSTVWAIDVNPRALELTAKNAGDLPVEAVLPEDVPDEVMFDAIWSNPPIRAGKQVLHELMLTWLPRLKPTGEARLVVGKNLGADSLHRWLQEQGYEVERTASSKGFRVLTVRPQS